MRPEIGPGAVQRDSFVDPENSAMAMPLKSITTAIAPAYELAQIPPSVQAQQSTVSTEPIPQIGVNTPKEVANAAQKTERLLNPPDVSTSGAGQVEMPAPVSQQVQTVTAMKPQAPQAKKALPDIRTFFINSGGISLPIESKGGYSGELRKLREEMGKWEGNRLVRTLKVGGAVSLDDALTRAKEAGYLSEDATLDDLIEALREKRPHPVTAEDEQSKLLDIENERRENIALRRRIERNISRLKKDDPTLTYDELRELSFIDKDTGLPNKLAYERDLDKNMDGVTVAIDMNGLKYVNDTFGHGAGDDFIRHFAAVMQTELGSHFYRIGGDEFSAIFPNLKDAHDAMDTLQEVVKELQFEITANDGTVLVVKGVTYSYGTGQGRNAKEHKESSDADLYRDKVRAKARGDRPSEPGAKPPRLSVREAGRRDNIDPFEDNSGSDAGTETVTGEDISQSENIALVSPDAPAPPKKAAQPDMFGAKTGLQGPIRTESVDLTKDNLFTRADTVQAEKNAKEDAERQASLYDEIGHKPDTISEEAAPYEAKGTTKEETQVISELPYDSGKAHTVTAKAGKDAISISAGKRAVNIPVIRKQTGTESGMYYILGDREGKTFALKTSLVNFGTVAINFARNGYDNLRATPEIVSRGEDITNLSDDEGKFLYSGIHVPTMIDQIRTTLSKSRDADGNIFYEGIRESDLKALEEVWNLPNWIAQEHPEFMQHKQIEVDRQERREEMLHELLQSQTQKRAGEHHEFLSLSKEDEAVVAKLIVESDADNRLIGKKELEERGITTPQMIAYYAWKRSMDKALELIIENYKKISLIPYEDRAYYDKLKEIMDMDATGIEVRQRALELASKMPQIEADAFLDDVDSLTPDKGSIKDLRAQLKGLNFYMPRTRGQGEYVARVRDEDGNVIWSERTTSNPRGGALVKIGQALRINEAKRIEKRLRAEFPDARIEWKHEPHTPEFMYQEMTDAAIERFLDKTIEKVREGGKVSSSDLNAVKDAIKQTLVDDLKARGFGKHAIHRKRGAPIGGYKTEGLKQVFVDYMSGAAGFMSKSEAAMRHHLALQNLPNAKPRLMQYAQKYVKDMMRNQTKIDRVSGRLRAMAYTWYLMGNIRFAAVQITQNYVAAIPELATHTKRATWKYHKAMTQIASGQGLTAEEKAALDKAYNAGITKDQYLREVTARIHGGPRSAWRKTIDALSIPFRGMEIFNRKSSFLAAWRVAKYEKKMSSDDAYDFARQFVDNTQFWMSKANLPGWARGEGAASGIARTLYTFKSFQQNYMLLLRKWAKQGPDGYRAIAYSMAWLAAFGGAGAVPFLDDILDLLEQITGYPARKIVKDRLKKYGDVVAKIGTQGIPALIGIDLSGSLKMEVPFLKAASSALTLGQVNAGGGASDVWGVYSGLGQKAAKGAHFVSQKEMYRAAEQLAPVFIENAMKGYRQMSGPVLDDKGRPMFDERTGKPFVLSTAEGIGQMAGFRPARTADISKEKRMAQNLDGYFDRRRADITEAYRYAAQAKDKDAIRKVMDDIKEYNKDAMKYPKVAAPITGQTLQRALKPKQNKAVRAFLGLDTAD